MDLLIIVTGLVLLVPDTANDRLHLIFPETAPMGGHVHDHRPRIEYRGTTTGMRTESLSGWSLDLGELGKPGIETHLYDYAVPFGELGYGIHRDTLLSSHRVEGRVTLPFPDEITPYFDAHWLLAGIPQGSKGLYLSNEVHLTYRFNRSDAPMWLRTRFGTTTAGNPQLEAPATNGPRMRIRISNLPDHPEEPKRGEESTHFLAYIHLLGLPMTPSQRLRLVLDEMPWRAPLKLRYALPLDFAGEPFNCMVAWAPIKP